MSSQWLENLKIKDLSTKYEVLAITINSLLDEIEDGKIQKVNQQLLEIDMTQSCPSHLVAVMSSLYSLRYNLSNWVVFKNNIIKELYSRNFNVEESLKGLLN
jgi:hypothetical protein